jgi:7,8-dihydropterin-6-yl-methyl-4-(beta-D-ribofuranosyl)aminobenzene 5'-phosphate synthase
MDRRSFLASCAALATAAAVPVRASTASFKVPVIDALTLTVLTDNATFGPFLPDLDLPGLKVRYAGNGPADGNGHMQARTLTSEFGLSLMADSRIGNTARRVLVDFGYTATALANNMALLGIDPETINAAVLSHGHLDHYGGFRGVFRDRHRPTLPLYVGGEEAFCERIAMTGLPPPLMGTLDRTALRDAGYAVLLVPQPEIVVDQAFTTGTIPLATSEYPAIPTRMRPGIGCDRGRLRADKRGQREVADDAEHELATCYALNGRGLVVISSCSHRGIINSVRRAQAISGIAKVHMVIGGFHLVRPRTPDEARQTVQALATINPAYIVPMHCTGEIFIEEALRQMPGKIVRPYVGTRLEMGLQTISERSIDNLRV